MKHIILLLLLLISVNNNTLAKSAIIGDSNVGVLSSNKKYDKRIDIIYYKVGINTLGLYNTLHSMNTVDKYDTIYVMIGTNDLYNLNTKNKNNMVKLNNLILTKFSKVKKIIYIYGTYGWGGTKNVTKNMITNYYNYILNLNSKNGILRVPFEKSFFKTCNQAHNTNSKYIDFVIKKI